MRVYYENAKKSKYVKYDKKLDFVKNCKNSIYDSELKDDDLYFLIDEDSFNYCSESYSFHNVKGFDENRLQEIINKKLADNRQNHFSLGTFLSAQVENILIDGVSKEDLIGQYGDVYFKLNFLYLKQDIVREFQKSYSSDFLNKDNIHIYPKSYFILQTIKENLKKQDFNIVYILEEYTKFIYVKNGFYRNIKTIDLGQKAYKTILKEQGLLDLYYNTKKESSVDENKAQKLNEASEFYSGQLFKWIKELIETDREDIILISDFIQNKKLFKYLENKYRNSFDGFLVPFHCTKKFCNFDFDWSVDQYDILAFLNYEL